MSPAQSRLTLTQSPTFEPFGTRVSTAAEFETTRDLCRDMIGPDLRHERVDGINLPLTSALLHLHPWQTEGCASHLHLWRHLQLFYSMNST